MSARVGSKSGWRAGLGAKRRREDRKEDSQAGHGTARWGTFWTGREAWHGVATGGDTTRQRTSQVVEAAREGKKARQGPARWENRTRQGKQPGSLAQPSPMLAWLNKRA